LRKSQLMRSWSVPLPRTLPAGFIAPCLPTKAHTLPSGSDWPHEIKHDGFRIIARKSDGKVRLYSRPGNEMTRRFPLIAEAAEARGRRRLGQVKGRCSEPNMFETHDHRRTLCLAFYDRK
jgi:ATP-dependent DNA ligase